MKSIYCPLCVLSFKVICSDDCFLYHVCYYCVGNRVTFGDIFGKESNIWTYFCTSIQQKFRFSAHETWIILHFQFQDHSKKVGEKRCLSFVWSCVSLICLVYLASNFVKLLNVFNKQTNKLSSESNNRPAGHIASKKLVSTSSLFFKQIWLGKSRLNKEKL